MLPRSRSDDCYVGRQQFVVPPFSHRHRRPPLVLDALFSSVFSPWPWFLLNAIKDYSQVLGLGPCPINLRTWSKTPASHNHIRCHCSFIIVTPTCFIIGTSNITLFQVCYVTATVTLLLLFVRFQQQEHDFWLCMCCVLRLTAIWWKFNNVRVI